MYSLGSLLIRFDASSQHIPQLSWCGMRNYWRFGGYCGRCSCKHWICLYLKKSKGYLMVYGFFWSWEREESQTRGVTSLREQQKPVSECGHKTSPTRLSRWNAICGPRPDQAGGWGKPVGQCFTGSGQRREEMGRYWFGFQGTANIGHPNINWRNLHVSTSKLLPKLHPILQKRGLGETRKIISKWACFLP